MDATPPARIGIIAGIVAVAAAVGLLAGITTEDDEGVTALAPDQAPPPSQPEYVSTLRDELETLAATRTAELQRLREARTSARLATASSALAGAYRKSATLVARPQLPASLEPSREAAVKALSGAAIAYRRLGAAATGDNRSRYESAREAVRRAEESLARSLEANLNAVGTG